MTDDIKTSKPSDRTAEYREGFYEGARTILKAIGDDLPEEQMRVLEKWVSGPVSAWRQHDVSSPPPQLPMIDGA